MANVGTVTFDVAAETAKLRSELDKVKKDVGGLAATAKNFEAGLKKIGGVLVGVFSIGAISAFASKINQAGDRLNDLSQRLGVSASRLNVIELAATQAGASTDAVSTAMAKLTENVGSAAMGNKAAAAAISTLGLSTAELIKLRPDETFEAVTAALSRMPNEFQRAAVAQDLLGKGAKELSQFYREGETAIDQAQAALERHGATLSDIDVARIGVMNDDLAAQGTIVTNLGIKMLSTFSPAVEVAVGAFSNLLQTVGGTTEAGKTMGVVFVGVVKAIESAADLIMAAFEGVRSVVSFVIGSVLKGLEKLVGGFAWVSEKLGLDAVARVQRDIQEGLSGIAESMFAIAEASNTNAGVAVRSAWKAATDILRSAEIFDEASRNLESRAEAAAARAPGRSASDLRQTPESVTSRILTEESLGVGSASSGVSVEGPSDFTFEQQLQGIYDRNLEMLKEAGVFRQQEWERQLNDMGIALGNSISYQTSLEAAKYATWGGLAGEFFSVIGSSNKKMAKLQQGMALAQAIWWTASGVANALRSVPFPANIAAAAKVAVMGALQIAKIRSTQYSESGSVGGGGFGGLGGGGEGGGQGSFSTPAAVTQQEPQRMAQVIIQGDVFASSETVNYLVDKIREAVNDRDVSFIDVNSRQALELGAGA